MRRIDINHYIQTTRPDLLHEIIILTDNSTDQLSQEVDKYFGWRDFIRYVITSFSLSLAFCFSQNHQIDGTTRI